MPNPGLVQVTWPMLREYIGVEVRLAIARHDLNIRRFGEAKESELRAHIGSLEKQSTLLETAFREVLPDSGLAELKSVAERLSA